MYSRRLQKIRSNIKKMDEETVLAVIYEKLDKNTGEIKMFI